MDKLKALKNKFQELDRVIIAYSGGVDSALLLAVAHGVLGDKAWGVTLSSPVMTEEEMEEAVKFAESMGAHHHLLPAHDLDSPEFCANTPDRCYYCKKNRLLLLKDLALQHNIPHIVEGSNMDDLNDYRPGSRAGRELGVKSPLQEVGLSKSEIRSLAKDLGLSVWDKPSQPCLATRIPFDTPITDEILTRVKRGEAFLHSILKKGPLRVRHHGNLARIELPEELIREVMNTPLAKVIHQEFKNLGYAYTTVDLIGYRQGSMNETIGGGQKINV